MATKTKTISRKGSRRKSSDRRWLGGTAPSHNRRKSERRLGDRRDDK